MNSAHFIILAFLTYWLIGFWIGKKCKFSFDQPAEILPDYSLYYRFLKWSLRLGTLFLVSLAFFKDPFWNLPVWFGKWFKECMYLWLGALLLSFAGTASSTLTFKSSVKIKVFLLNLLLILAAFLFWFRFDYPMLHEVSKKTKDGLILQSTSYTCIPACCSNVLRFSGIDRSEKELAYLMRTNKGGTSISAASWVMYHLFNLDNRRLETNLSELKKQNRPGILLVDHPSTGPESHAVLFIRSGESGIEGIDPLLGAVVWNETELKKIWHGKVLSFLGNQPVLK